ncbi:MAG: hypothetical protein RIC81_05995 [Microcella pacifica]|uniref:hypothetical protein n=1 Tax=Microcella pacifica TaxID=2591847 RepID=UPI0033146319
MNAKPLPREVEHTISTYRPQLPAQHWNTVAHFTRTVVTAARPANRPIALKMLNLVSRLAVWAWQTAGVDLTIASVMRQSVIDRFVTDVHRHSNASTRSRAATVLAHVSAVVTGDERPVTKVKYAESLGAPYLPSDEAWLRGWPDKQSTAGRRRNAHGVLGLCRGAGLTRHEVELVRVSDVHLSDATPHALVRGARPRIAPINPAWANHLELVMATAGAAGDFLLAPASTAARRSLMSEITSRLDAHGPRPHRLRSTWIVEWLQLAPAPYVLTIAGLSTFQAFDRHLPYVTFGLPTEAGEQ